MWVDDTWLMESTPIECSRSVPTTKRSRRAGWASYGYALANPKLDERDIAIDMFDHDPIVLAGRARPTIIAHKGDESAELECIPQRLLPSPPHLAQPPQPHNHQPLLRSLTASN